MRYQHLKITRKIRKIILPMLPIGVAVVLFSVHFQMPNFITNTVFQIAKPTWSFRNALQERIAIIKNALKTKNTLIQENTIYRDELLQLRREVFLTSILKQDNARLLALLNRAREKENFLPASVISDDSFSPYDTFILDIGSEHGVREGMIVFTPEGIAVGVVSAILEKTATVAYFSAPTMSIDVVLNATTSIHTTLKGYGSGTMILSLPRDVEVATGNTVQLPTFLTYPIGEVVDIEAKPEDAYKTIYVKSPVNIHTLRYVFLDVTTSWKKIEEQNASTTKQLQETQSD